MKVEHQIVSRVHVVVVALLMMGLSTACNHNGAQDSNNYDDDSLYESYDLPDTTSAEVESWLQRVELDSVERVICHDDGLVQLDGKRVKVWFSDIIRCCPDRAMDYPFKALVDSMGYTIQNTPDGRMRIFVWDSQLGGTNPDLIRNVLLRLHDGSVAIADSGSESHGLIATYLLKGHNDDTLYMFHEFHTLWNGYVAEMIRVYKINGNKLDVLSTFPNGQNNIYTEGKNRGSFYFEIDGDNVYKRLIDDDKHTDRWLQYNWDGDTFDELGNVGNHHLHPSLWDYVAFKDSLVTRRLYIRIDSMSDGSYRYASWKRDKSTSDKPNLVIFGGHQKDDRSYCEFENNGYVYRVGNVAHAFGNQDDYCKGIVVQKNGKTVLLQREVFPVIE